MGPIINSLGGLLDFTERLQMIWTGREHLLKSAPKSKNKKQFFVIFDIFL